MMHSDPLTYNKITQKSSGAHYVLGLLERDRIIAHIDGRLRVAIHNAGPVNMNTVLDQKIPTKKHLASSKHSTKVLGLSTGQRNGALHLRKPKEEAAVEEHQASAARKLRRPRGVDKRLHPAVSIRREHKGAVPRTTQVDQNAKALREVRHARISKEAGELASSKSKLRERHIGQPEISTHQGHIHLTFRSHSVILGGSNDRLIVRRKDDTLIKRSIKVPGRRLTDVLRVLGKQIGNIERLRHRKRTSRTVTGDGDMKDPRQLALINSREAGTQVSHKTRTQRRIVVCNDRIINVDKNPQNIIARSISIQANVDS
mmetsp:Transcript_7161/g.18642  ORF Transcript_7161/g.18642 Transcript_7161/m.18642 type:complete len:315 (-) Transcript_7161:1487-2431(-)